MADTLLNRMMSRISMISEAYLAGHNRVGTRGHIEFHYTDWSNPILLLCAAETQVRQ